MSADCQDFVSIVNCESRIQDTSLLFLDIKMPDIEHTNNDNNDNDNNTVATIAPVNVEEFYKLASNELNLTATFS